MASAQPVNVFAATAYQIISTSNLSEHEEIFKEALENFKRKLQDTKFTPSLLLQFGQATSSHTFLEAFDECRANNTLWQESKGNSLLRKSGRVAEQALGFQAIGDGLAMINQGVGGPIWGLLHMALSTLKNITITDGNLKLVRERLEKCSGLYQTLHINQRRLDGHLRSSLVSFAEVVIEFCFIIGDVLSNGPFKSWLSAATRSLDSRLLEISKKLDYAANDVMSSISIRTHQNVEDMKRAQAFPQGRRVEFPNVSIMTAGGVKVRKNMWAVRAGA